MSLDSRIHVRVARSFTAPPARVFDAWLDPDQIGSWMFGPAVREEEVLRITLEPRVGGAFSFLVRRQGDELDHVGEYLEMDRPHRLAFTWAIAGIDGTDRVTVEISPQGAGCDLTLTHELPQEWESYADRTAEAWAKMLGALAATLE